MAVTKEKIQEKLALLKSELEKHGLIVEEIQPKNTYNSPSLKVGCVDISIDEQHSAGYYRGNGQFSVNLQANWDLTARFPQKKDGTFSYDKIVSKIEELKQRIGIREVQRLDALQQAAKNQAQSEANAKLLAGFPKFKEYGKVHFTPSALAEKPVSFSLAKYTKDYLLLTLDQARKLADVLAEDKSLLEQ